MQNQKKNQDEFDRSSLDYFKEISKFKPLPLDVEIDLWKKYKNENDISARDKLVKANLKFVAKEAGKFQGRGLSYADLIAEGNMGLLKSFEKFDYCKNLKTISYSVWWIRQSILEALKKRNSISGDEIGVIPENSEQYESYENIDDNDCNYVDFEDEGSDEYPYMQYEEQKGIILSLLNVLTEKEKNVIIKYYGLNCKEMTLEEIGKSVGLTKERIRQIKESALKKLRSEAMKKSITSDIYN